MLLGGDDVEMVGRPGYTVFELVGIAEGECNFKIAHVRPWEFEFENERTAAKAIDLIEFELSVVGAA